MNTTATIAALLVEVCGRSAASYAPHVIHAAQRYQVDPKVVVSMMRQESHCQKDAVGAKNEQGLMQLKRHTIATRGYNRLSDKQLREPRLNIRLGARHLRYCLDKCNGDLPGALGMYTGLAKSKKTGRCRASPYSWAVLRRLKGR